MVIIISLPRGGVGTDRVKNFAPPFQYMAKTSHARPPPPGPVLTLYLNCLNYLYYAIRLLLTYASDVILYDYGQ